MSSPGSEYVPDNAYQAGETPHQGTKRKSAKGRKLMRWNPEKDQQVLLCLEYVVARDGIDLDWNLVAKEVEPFLTGDAIKQHLLKLRAAREAEGQPNPPKLDRKAVIAAKKKTNPLVDTSKAARTSKRQTKRKSDNADDEDEDEDDQASKPVPKTTGLLHIKTERYKPSPQKANTISAKKQKKKIKTEEESEEETGYPPFEKEQDEDEPSPTKKKSPLPSNFPSETPRGNSPVSAPIPSYWASEWVQNQATWVGGMEEESFGLGQLERTQGGSLLEPPPGLVFSAGGGGPSADLPVMEDPPLSPTDGDVSGWNPPVPGNEGDMFGPYGSFSNIPFEEY